MSQATALAALDAYNRGDTALALRQCADSGDSSAVLMRVWGGLLAKEQRNEEAVAVLSQAIGMVDPSTWAEPDNAQCISNLAHCLNCLGRLSDAAPWYSWLASHSQDNTAILLRCVHFFGITGQTRQAIETCRRVIELLKETHADPQELARAELKQALYQLRSGQWTEAWPAYRRRFDIYNMDRFRLDDSVPIWTGDQPLEGKLVGLIPEQGIGDSIMLARYAPVLRERGASLVIGGEPSLERLFAHSGLFDQVLTAGQSADRPDYRLYLHELPAIFRSTPETLPQTVPYLSAEPGFLLEQSLELDSPKALKVGINWAGNPNFPNDTWRSTHLQQWQPILQLAQQMGPERLQLYSLQKGQAAAQLQASPYRDVITDLGPHLTDFYDTARAMVDLDCVLTTCTSVAHLAGALGSPGKILLNKGPHWIWLDGHETNPWYPSLGLLRQQIPHRWEAPIAGAAQWVAEQVRNRTANTTQHHPLPTTTDRPV